MKPFKTVAIVKHHPDIVSSIVRDRLPELVSFLDDIEQITVVERVEAPDGTVRLVNHWKANPPIPPMLASVIDPTMLAWLDRVEWNPSGLECRWRIEPQFLAGRTRCEGLTRYEPALGGKGTKIVFDGQLDVTARGLAGVPALVENMVSNGIEAFVTTLIPKNFRRLAEAISSYLDAKP